jgi:hypothetical protein
VEARLPLVWGLLEQMTTVLDEATIVRHGKQMTLKNDVVRKLDFDSRTLEAEGDAELVIADEDGTAKPAGAQSNRRLVTAGVRVPRLRIDLRLFKCRPPAPEAPASLWQMTDAYEAFYRHSMSVAQMPSATLVPVSPGPIVATLPASTSKADFLGPSVRTIRAGTLVHWVSRAEDAAALMKCKKGDRFQCDDMLCTHLDPEWQWIGPVKLIIRVEQGTDIRPIQKYNHVLENAPEGTCVQRSELRDTEVRLFPGVYKVAHVLRQGRRRRRRVALPHGILTKEAMIRKIEEEDAYFAAPSIQNFLRQQMPIIVTVDYRQPLYERCGSPNADPC